MSSRAQTLRGLLTFGLVLLAARADAQLATKSPFISASAGNTGGPTAGAPLEYRGMMQTAQGLKVRIVDPSRHAGAWLLADEKDPSFDVVVKAIDLDHDTVTIDYQGRSMTLAQHVAKVASAGAPQMPMSPGQIPGTNMPAGIAQSVMVNPTPADEQRRLEAVASEVARRRQLREQASQQVSQGIQVAPQIIQQQQEQRQQVQQQALPQRQNAGQEGNNALRQQRGTGPQRPRGN